MKLVTHSIFAGALGALVLLGQAHAGAPTDPIVIRVDAVHSAAVQRASSGAPRPAVAHRRAAETDSVKGDDASKEYTSTDRRSLPNPLNGPRRRPRQW